MPNRKKNKVKPTVEQVARRIHRTMALTNNAMKKRLNNNAYGYTSAEIYAAMGQDAASAVQGYIAQADTAITAIGVAQKAAAVAAGAVVAAPATTDPAPTPAS